MKRIVALDTETTGLDPFKGQAFPFLYIVAEQGKETLVTKTATDILPYILDMDCDIIMHNAMFDISMLKVMGFPIEKLEGRCHDTTTLMHLLYEEEMLNLESLALRYLGKNKLTDLVKNWFNENGYKKDEWNYTGESVDPAPRGRISGG